MKRFFLLTVYMLSLSQIFADSNDSVLLTIDETNITKSEFLRIYNKNNDNVYDSKSVDEYIDLFINFKLKVIEAEKLGLDTTKKFIDEFSGYKKQLEEPYLTLKSIDDSLLNEAYERMKEEIHVSHILIKVGSMAAPDDTLKAYSKAKEIMERVVKGENFEKVAKATSDDPSAKRNGGDLGFVTVGQFIYKFETAAYNLMVGQVSDPVRTRYGYHIIKLNNRRPAKGTVRAAHIMVAVPENSSEDSVDRAKKRIDDIYAKIKAGGNFEELAAELSDDRRSARNGGEIGWFGVGRMVNEFEEAALALEKVGDISGIVRTAFGFHIIKLLGKKEIGSFEEEKNRLQDIVNNSERNKKKDEAFIYKMKAEYNFEEYPKAKYEFYSLIDTSIYAVQPTLEAKNLKKVLFKFDENEVKQGEFYEYLLDVVKVAGNLPIPVLIDTEYEKFVAHTLKEYERGMLEKKYPDYRHLVEEYHDGILLFELTDSLVWSKAVKDTIGLEKFYQKNKNDYMWEDRVLATKFSCANQEVADQARELINSYINKNKKVDTESILKKINGEDTVLIEVITDKYAKGQDIYIDSIEWKPGMSDFLVDEDKVLIIQIIQNVKPEPKLLDEARGLVIADYQAYLEEKWVNELRKKYKIQINKDVLSSIK